MKISTKGRYALRLMLDLAQHNTGCYIPLREIASRQEISDKYLEQIIHNLSRSGFVQSIRGAQGGYRLTMAPEQYTVGMILRTVEGSLAPVACLECVEEEQCSRHSSCATLRLFQEIYSAVNNVVDNTTLADLVQQQNTLSNTANN